MLLGLAWLMASLGIVEDCYNYFSAKNTQNVEAVLQSYTWHWNSSKEQYEIDARYRWEFGNSTGTYRNKEYKSPGYSGRGRRVHGDRTGLTHQGKDSDPAEVRPLRSVTLQAYQKGDGTWKVESQTTKDMLYIIGGYILVVVAGAWLFLSGILMMFRRPKQN